MMMKLQDAINQWMEKGGNPKRRFQIFIISLILIYLIWVFLFYRPLRISKNTMTTQMQALQSQLTETQHRIQQLKETVSNEAIAKKLSEKKQLDEKVQKVNQAIAKNQLLFISKEDWKTLKKEVVTQQDDMDANITLESIVDLPVQPWVPPTVEKSEVSKIVTETVYLHGLEVKFLSDYFSAVRYVARLEKLRWHVYWDSLNYKVLTYPKAEVTLKFHIFTQEKSET